jgi:hypothetical protein
LMPEHRRACRAVPNRDGRVRGQARCRRRFEVAFEIARLNPDVARTTPARDWTGLDSDHGIHLPDGRGPRRGDCPRRVPWRSRGRQAADIATVGAKVGCASPTPSRQRKSSSGQSVTTRCARLRVPAVLGRPVATDADGARRGQRRAGSLGRGGEVDGLGVWRCEIVTIGSPGRGLIPPCSVERRR